MVSYACRGIHLSNFNLEPKEEKCVPSNMDTSLLFYFFFNFLKSFSFYQSYPIHIINTVNSSKKVISYWSPHFFLKSRGKYFSSLVYLFSFILMYFVLLFLHFSILGLAPDFSLWNMRI